MASQSRIEALKSTPEINYGDECCSICLREFVRGDICRVLPRCGHMFHKDCIDQWLLNRSLKCPVCRRQAVVEEKPRKARKRISLEWILLGAAATYVVILYGSLAYSLYGYHKVIQYTCNTIMKLRSKDENNMEFEILEESS